MGDYPPLLARPFEAGVAGWAVVFGVGIVELIAGTVTNQMPMSVAAPALIAPVVIAAGFALVQWQQVRSSGAEPANWWHLVGIAGALFTWLVVPTNPGILAPAGSSRTACEIVFGQPTAECLARATRAMDYHNLVWWLTGALVLGAALLARRSRIAAWAAIPAAFAGCLLAAHFLELFILHYRPGG